MRITHRQLRQLIRETIYQTHGRKLLQERDLWSNEPNKGEPMPNDVKASDSQNWFVRIYDNERNVSEYNLSQRDIKNRSFQRKSRIALESGPDAVIAVWGDGAPAEAYGLYIDDVRTLESFLGAKSINDDSEFTQGIDEEPIRRGDYGPLVAYAQQKLKKALLDMAAVRDLKLDRSLSRIRRVMKLADDAPVDGPVIDLLEKSIDPDGDFGRRTQAGVMAFQDYLALEVDGVIGPQTAARLVNFDLPAAAPDPVGVTTTPASPSAAPASGRPAGDTAPSPAIFDEIPGITRT